jgi:hypothetical protein
MPGAPLLPRTDLSINYLVSGEFCTNVLHYIGPATPPTQDQCQAMADAESELWGGIMAAWLPKASEYLGLELRYLSANAGRYAASEESAGPGTVGPVPTASEDFSLPSEVAAVIRKIGDGPVKRANGTAFLGGIADGHSDGSRLNALGGSIARGIADRFKGILSGPGFEATPAVLSRTAQLLYPIVGVTLAPVLGHQRRRRPVR